LKSFRIHLSWRCRSCLILSWLAVLTACGHVQEKTFQVPDDWESQQAHNGTIDSWYIQGRLGVQAEHQGGSLDVFWNQQGEHYQVRLIAPMGQGAFFVDGDQRRVTLTNADGITQTSSSADQLFSQSLGVSLPLASLQRWLRGLPAEGDASLQWNDQGQLNIVEQGGWRVEMSRYRPEADFNLPHAFYLSRADQPELMVRLLLRSWQLRDLPPLEPQP
jgi:outer membrane lipoprotein LolB